MCNSCTKCQTDILYWERFVKLNAELTAILTALNYSFRFPVTIFHVLFSLDSKSDFCWVPSHCEIFDNKHIDELVKEKKQKIKQVENKCSIASSNMRNLVILLKQHFTVEQQLRPLNGAQRIFQTRQRKLVTLSL